MSKAGLKPAADSLLASSAYIQALAINDKLEGNSSATLIKLQELSGANAFNFKSALAHFAKPVVFIEERKTLISNSHPILSSLKHQADFYTAKSAIENRALLPSVHFLGGILIEVQASMTMAMYLENGKMVLPTMLIILLQE